MSEEWLSHEYISKQTGLDLATGTLNGQCVVVEFTLDAAKRDLSGLRGVDFRGAKIEAATWVRSIWRDIVLAVRLYHPDFPTTPEGSNFPVHSLDDVQRMINGGSQ